MGRRTSIPVRVVRPTEYRAVPPVEKAGAPPAPVPAPTGVESRTEVEEAQVISTAKAAEEVAMPASETRDEAEEWHERALRLQAEMDNYRKRQQRWAQDQIEAERHRLLGAFLQVVDDLERALAAQTGEGEGLRRGVELTHRGAVQLLQKEGVEPVEAVNQPFDPNWHEAVATVARNGSDIAPHTVIQVMQQGYRQGDRLLRPAKVVVAV